MDEPTNEDILSVVRKAFANRTDLGATTLSGRVRLPNPNPPEFEEELRVEEITPERAMSLIAGCWERYENGRNFYPTKLDKIMRYAKAMEGGNWVYDVQGDPICITDGLVTGGRHRLHAVLLSHKTITSNVLHRTKKENPSGRSS